MKSSSASNLFWALAGAAGFGVLMFLVFHFQSTQTPSEQLALKAKKIQLTGEIRVALASAAEAEKSAVLAITDEESIAFANQARAATATVEQKRVALGELLPAAAASKENELLVQFSKEFSEFQRVDNQLLELAVKNTNIKASALALGPAAQAMKEMDGALSHLLGQSAKSSAPNAKEMMLAAAGAQAAALRIQLLIPQHIAEESDKKMDELESLMASQDQEVRKDLAALAPAGSADVQAATASYARLTELKTQILKLSRENTNVRSLSISLNQKRKITVLCQDALAALENAVEQEHIAGVDDSRVKPR